MAIHLDRHLVIAVSFAFLAGALPAQRPPAPDASDKAAGEYRTGKFKSESLGREVGYAVHLPPGYEEEKDRKYPIVFWLHGMFENHERFERRGGGGVLAELNKSGKFPPIILACVDGGRTSFYCNGVKSGAYEDLVVKDWIPFIEKTFRAVGTREGRAIAGVSMGGNGALKIAFKHPDMFSAVATHSAALFPVDLEKLPDRFRHTLESQFGEQFKAIWGDPVDKQRWAADNPLALIEKLKPADLGGMAIYMDCGDHDNYGFNRPNEELHALLDKRGIKHEWYELPGGHGWDYASQYLPQSLEFVAQQFKRVAKNPAAGKSPAAGKDPGGAGGGEAGKRENGASGDGKREPGDKPRTPASSGSGR